MSATNNDLENIIETIDIYLIGDENEISEAIRLVDANFKERIVGIVHRRAPSANVDDLRDIYQKVLLEIYKLAKEGKYDPDKGTLKALIGKIASNEAIDWLRWKYAKKRTRDTNKDVLVDSVAETIRDSNIHEAWQCAQQNEQRDIILDTIRSMIPKLKLRQRQVAEIIKEEFPNLLNDIEIKERIMQIYNEDVTAVAVRSAKKEVYKKVKEALTTTGYGDWIDD